MYRSRRVEMNAHFHLTTNGKDKIILADFSLVDVSFGLVILISTPPEKFRLLYRSRPVEMNADFHSHNVNVCNCFFSVLLISQSPAIKSVEVK